MNTVKIAFTLFAIATIIACNGQSKSLNSMKYEEIDTLCQAMSYECKNEVKKTLDGMAPEQIANNWFAEYWLHDDTETSRINVSEKRLKEGKLVRIAEGTFRWERQKHFDKEYDKPTEMCETEYFFLNNELVKICISKGHTDYNAIPSNYWIVIRQLDLMCKKSNIENRKLYWYIWGGVTQGDEEAVEQYMKEWGVDENTLIQQAGMLYENFKTSP